MVWKTIFINQCPMTEMWGCLTSHGVLHAIWLLVSVVYGKIGKTRRMEMIDGLRFSRVAGWPNFAQGLLFDHFPMKFSIRLSKFSPFRAVIPIIDFCSLRFHHGLLRSPGLSQNPDEQHGISVVGIFPDACLYKSDAVTIYLMRQPLLSYQYGCPQ